MELHNIECPVTAYDLLYFVQHHFPRTLDTLLIIALIPYACFPSTISAHLFTFLWKLKPSKASKATFIYKKSPIMHINLLSNHFNKIIVMKV